MGFEYMYMYSEDKREWIRKRIETPGIMEMPKEKKRLLFNRLLRATRSVHPPFKFVGNCNPTSNCKYNSFLCTVFRFENFLAKKWVAEKRFGLEGCEVLIPCIKEIIDVCSNNGVETFVIGLPHRGRLNTLANVCRKSLEEIFAQFHGIASEDMVRKGAASTL